METGNHGGRDSPEELERQLRGDEAEYQQDLAQLLRREERRMQASDEDDALFGLEDGRPGLGFDLSRCGLDVQGGGGWLRLLGWVLSGLVLAAIYLLRLWFRQP